MTHFGVANIKSGVGRVPISFVYQLLMKLKDVIF